MTLITTENAQTITEWDDRQAAAGQVANEVAARSGKRTGRRFPHPWQRIAQRKSLDRLNGWSKQEFRVPKRPLVIGFVELLAHRVEL